MEVVEGGGGLAFLTKFLRKHSQVHAPYATVTSFLRQYVIHFLRSGSQ